MADKKQAEETTTPEKTALITEGRPYPEIIPGCLVKVHERITEVNAKGETKQRIQIFEGMVIQRQHGKGVNATITVRKISDGIGVEKIYPLASPVVEKILVVRRYKVHRSNLSYLRNYFKKLKEIKPAKV